MVLPKIYNYKNYRIYLKDIFEYFKNQKISVRKIAKELNLSNAYFTMILNGKRNFDKKYVEVLADYLNLNNSERSYFMSLIIIADEEDSRKRSDAYRKLSRFRSYQEQNMDDIVTHKYLEHWYYVAIRELSFLTDFVEDPIWIQEKFLPKLKIREIENALKFLKKYNLLSSHDDSHLNCTEGLFKLSLTHFHQDMLEIIAESIPRVKRNDRNILGFTKSLDKKSFEKAKKIMANAMNELEQLCIEDKKSELYHFYFLGTPLTYEEREK